jgi:hypothetical protein
MYNVSSGPSKIAAKTRRHHKQQLEVLQDNSRTRSKEKHSPAGSPPGAVAAAASPHSPYSPTDVDAAAMSAPRPVFTSQQSTNRKSSHSFSRQNSEPLAPQHEEMVRFISSEWQRVQQEFDAYDPSRSKKKLVYYKDVPASQCPHLQNFEPVDLETWWGDRFLQGIDLPNTT